MTKRPMLDSQNIHPVIRDSVEHYHADIIAQVTDAISNNKAVVIGMTVNPSVKKACKLLASQGLAVKYLEYGGYTSMWRQRLAIKMWSGWPTFPQVFINGTLVGGASDLQKLINTGQLNELL